MTKTTPPATVLATCPFCLGTGRDPRTHGAACCPQCGGGGRVAVGPDPEPLDVAALLAACEAADRAFSLMLSPNPDPSAVVGEMRKAARMCRDAIKSAKGVA